MDGLRRELNPGVEACRRMIIAGRIARLWGLDRMAQRFPRIHGTPEALDAYALGSLGLFWQISRWMTLPATG